MTSAFSPEHVLFVVSQPQLSRRREEALFSALRAASPLPAGCVRLEGGGTSLTEALESLVAAGCRAILVQPLGTPFSESLAVWLPGALAHWLQGAPPGVDVRLGADLALDPTVLAATAGAMLATSGEAASLEETRPTLGPRGWDDPGDASDHLLVCIGPRCHFRDAPRLRLAIADELRAAGALRHCQVTEISCVGPCNRGPIVAHYPQGNWYSVRSMDDIRALVTQILKGQGAAHLLAHRLPQRAAEETASAELA